MSEVTTFVDACVRGQACVEDVDNWVDAWHDAPDDSPIAALELHAYLGLDSEEASRWLREADAMETIVAKHEREAFEDANKYVG
jgi:hypothetical protein